MSYPNYTYNSMDQVTEVNKAVTGLPATVRNTYTYENDRIKTLTHSNTADASTTYTFNYGVFGLPTSIKAGEHTLMTNTYDTTNRTFNLLKALYGNGAYVEYTYDEYDRVVGMKYNGDTAERYTFHYDNCGALGRVRDNANNLETCYLYDFAGRLMEVNTKGLNGNTYTNKFTWSYDDLGRVTSFKFWVNGNACYSNYAYDQDNRLTQFSIGGIKKTWGYDSYGRISSIQCKYNDVANVTTTPTYTEPDTSHTSAQIKTWRNQALDYDVTYTYTYDDRGNILSVSDGTNTTSYVYDGLNQLTRENNQAANKTWVYSYDAGGNILSKIEYGYTTGEVVDPAATVNYEYNDAKGWKDILTSYNGVTRTHDEIGNLISDGTWTYTWEAGRRLKSMTKADGTAVTFAYDNKGLRLSKTVGDVTYRYTYNGGELVRIEDGTYTHNIRYDSSGQPMTIAYSGLEYFYVYNAQGDVVAIAKYDGTIVVEYTYDAWGNILSVTGEMAETLGKKNPFRYRGYVYDEETGLYYLKSRYYDPKVGRFICADGYASTGQGFLGMNVFAYCGNEPVDRMDLFGCLYDVAWAYHQERQMYAVMGMEYPYPNANRYYLKPSPCSYDSVKDAAIAFYKDNLNRSMYTRIEMGAEIISVNNNGKTEYMYTQPRFGEPHTVGMQDAPAGTKIVAFAHSHPNSNEFSPEDKDLAAKNNIDVYMVGPNQVLQVVNPNQMVDALDPITNARELTNSERILLVHDTRAIWDAHVSEYSIFNCPHGCKAK